MRLDRIPELLAGLHSGFAGLKDCHAALQRFAEAAQTYTGARQSVPLRAALIEAETALTAAYDKSAWISLLRIRRRELSNFIAAIRRNIWLLEEISARYLELHKSECWTLYEDSPSKARVINDLLSLTIAPDVVLSDQTAASIRRMVHLVHNQLSRIPYPPGYAVSTRWAEIVERAVRLALALRDPRHIAYASLAIFDVPIAILSNSDQAALEHRCEHTYYRNHPELRGIGDFPLGRPGTTIMLDGSPYSNKTEQGFFFYRELFTSLPPNTATDVVVEIGSGFGRLARIMRLAGRTKCFVLADLPDSLLFSYAFLKVSFPDARTHVISSTADITPDMESAYDFIFCPIQLLAALRLRRVDLVINTYSFSEMTQGCVDFLMRCIHEVLQPQFIYSLNIMFSQKALHFSTGGLHGEANENILIVDPVWQPVRFELMPSLDGSSYWISGSAILRRVPAESVGQRVRDMIDAASQADYGSTRWLGYMYLAALWARDPVINNEFFGGLQQYLAGQGITTRPEFNFEEIGEVKYLKARAA